MSEKMTAAMKEALRDLQSTGTTTAALSAVSASTLQGLARRGLCEMARGGWSPNSRFTRYQITPAGRAVDLGAAE